MLSNFFLSVFKCIKWVHIDNRYSLNILYEKLHFVVCEIFKSALFFPFPCFDFISFFLKVPHNLALPGLFTANSYRFYRTEKCSGIIGIWKPPGTFLPPGKHWLSGWLQTFVVSMKNYCWGDSSVCTTKNIFTIDFPPALIYHLTPSIMRFVGWFLSLSGIFLTLFFSSFLMPEEELVLKQKPFYNLNLGVCSLPLGLHLTLALPPLCLSCLLSPLHERNSSIEFISWELWGILVWYASECKFNETIICGKLMLEECFFFASDKNLKGIWKADSTKFSMQNQFCKLCHAHLLKLSHVWA